MSAIRLVKQKIEAIMTDFERSLLQRIGSSAQTPFMPSTFRIYKLWTNTKEKIHEPVKKPAKIPLIHKPLVKSEELKIVLPQEQSKRDSEQSAVIDRLQNKIEQLKTSKEKLCVEIAEINNSSRSTSVQQEAMINQLKDEVQVLKYSGHTEIENAKIAQQDEIIVRLKGEICTVRNNENALKEKLSKKETDVYELTSSTSEFLNKAMQDLDSRLSEMSNKAARLLYEKKTLNKELENLKNEQADREDSAKEHTKRIEDLTRQNELDKQLISAKEEEISKLYLTIQEYERRQQEIDSSPAESPPVEQSPAHEEGTQGILNRFVNWVKKPVIEIDHSGEEEEEEF